MFPSASPVPVQAGHSTAAEGKLELVEFLLGSLDTQLSAQQAVDWLVAHGAARRAVCLIGHEGAGQLMTLAESNAPPAADFSVELDHQVHPLVRLLDAPAPECVTPTPRFRLPLDAPFFCVPLRCDRQSACEGLLLAESDAPELHPDALWTAEVLSQQLMRLRSRQALAETRFGHERTLLYSIINAVTDPILLTDPEGKLIIANTRAERLLTSPDDASEGWRRAVALNNMLFSAALSSSAMDTPETRRELLLVDPIDGSDLLFELLSTAVRDGQRETFIVSVLRNVTDLGLATEEIDESYRRLRIAQAEIRDERHRLELIIDSVADPIVVTDPGGDIVLTNAPAEKLFTMQPDGGEESQRRVRANGARFSSFVSSLLSSGGERRWGGELSLIQPETGTTIPVEAIAGTILSDQGELTWVVTILHDRTEAIERAQLYDRLKRSSEQLEAKVQEATAELAAQNELLRRQHLALEQASALKSQFLANMSHEFRTPLNAILGYTHMLLHGVSGQLTEAQQKSLGRIDSNSRHLLALINDILDITRIEAGRMPLHVSSFSVRELMKEVMSELEPLVRRSRLQVNVSIPANLPALHSDRQKVKQIVLNLLTNALKFTPQGSVRIACRCDAAARRLAIRVRDTGIGISESDQRKVFEDFRQLDNSPTRGHGGTGLGLAICRRLATMLGGAITLKSREGAGSTFTLELPVRPRRK